MTRTPVTWLHLLILLAVVLLTGIYLICTTTLIAKDGVAYILYMQGLETDAAITIQQSDQHPGYPLLALAAHRLVLALGGKPSVWSWIYSAQAVALLSRTLALLIFYFLATRIVGRAKAFWASLLFACIPKLAEFGSDVLSDWTYFLFLLAGFLYLLKLARQGRWWLAGLVGLAAGLGYLVRPECIQLVVYGFFWLTVQLFRSPPVLPPRRAVAAMVLMSVTFFALAGPYMVFKGALFPKKHLGTFAAKVENPDNPTDQSAAQAKGTKEITASLAPLVSGFQELAEEFANTLMWYFLPALVIGNVVFFRAGGRRDDRTLLIGAAFVLNIVMLVWLQYAFGYISSRHTIMLIAFSILQVPLGVDIVADWLARLGERLPNRLGRLKRGKRFWVGVLLALGIGLFAVRLASPLRVKKSGYREAAAWLRENSEPRDTVVLLDPRIAFYAERPWLKGFREHYFAKAKYVVQEVEPGQPPLPYRQLKQVERIPLYAKKYLYIYRVTALPAGDLTGPWQLFVDDYLVADTEHVRRTVHAFHKHPANPVLVADRPWEGRMVYVYGTVLPLEEGSGYRMWYHSHHGGNEHRNLYATSPDGIVWNKPNLGLVPYEGSDENNLLRSGGGQEHIPSVIYTPWETDPNLRHKLVTYNNGQAPPVRPVGGFHGAYSPDGVHWTDVPGNPLLPAIGDVGNFVWDPHRERYLGFVKLFEQVGGHRRRCIGLTTSQDFEHWSPPRTILLPDELDDRWVHTEGQRTEFYGMSGFAYESMYLGFLWVFRVTDSRESGPVFVELVSSRDGEHWHRPSGERQPVLSPGPPGSWDEGMVFTTNHPLVEADTIKLWYGGFDAPHGTAADKRSAGIGLATLRKDGFVSLDAQEGQIASVTTKPLRGLRDQLRVNADVSTGGWLAVEVLDAEGQVLPGYGQEDCQRIRTDGVDMPVQWTNRKFLPDSKAPLRLRFTFYKTSLYSFAAGLRCAPAQP